MADDGRLSAERLAEFEDLAAGKVSEHRRADMLSKGEHGSHVWCYDPRLDGSGPLNLHSDECHLRTLLAHIDALEANLIAMTANRDYYAEQLQVVFHKQKAHIEAQQAEIDRLASQVSAIRKALERWTNLTDMSASDYHRRYDCRDWACAVDCFTAAARQVLADTEATAKEHDQRRRLEGARELYRRLLETFRWEEDAHVRSVLTDMEREAGK